MYIVGPVWFAAGLADYAWHRASRIELTSGCHERLQRIPGLRGAICPGRSRPDRRLAVAGQRVVLAFMVLRFVAHEATAIWDVPYANATRRVLPAEQHMHGVLEMAVPLTIGIATIMDGPSTVARVSGAYAEELARTLRREKKPA